MEKSDKCNRRVRSAKNGEIFISKIPWNPANDLPDSLPLICPNLKPNTIGVAAEALKPAFPNDASFRHNTGATRQL